MNDSKVERTRQQAMMFGRQFLQGDGSVFDQALGADAMAAAISTQAPAVVNASTPRWIRYACSSARFCQRIAPASAMRDRPLIFSETLAFTCFPGRKCRIYRTSA